MTYKQFTAKVRKYLKENYPDWYTTSNARKWEICDNGDAILNSSININTGIRYEY